MTATQFHPGVAPLHLPGERRRSAAELDPRELRAREFARLDTGGHAYLDFTGSALHSRTQAEAHAGRLRGEVLGNPHSENPPARQSTARMERARARVLEFFRGDPSVYEVVFTANASDALRRVGEAFPFCTESRFVLTTDNHNSVNGLRIFASRAGAGVRYVPLGTDLRGVEPNRFLEGAPRGVPHLFAFPAQSNFSGIQHPLEWVARAEALGYRVLLDAAAYVPTTRLRLDRVRPAFVALSFYKMFGFPTGLGALLARRDALADLRRPWFAGGTVEWVSTGTTKGEWGHQLRPGAPGFEDGTPHFLGFDDVVDGLDFLDHIGMEGISAHVASTTHHLLRELTALHHPDGRPLVRIHGPRSLQSRGGTVSFTVVDASGAPVPFEAVVEAAAARRVAVRGGCFCNPGCAESALAFDRWRARECRARLGENFSISSFRDCLGGPVGAVRASVGVPTVPEDIHRLGEVLREWSGVRIGGPR